MWKSAISKLTAKEKELLTLSVSFLVAVRVLPNLHTDKKEFTDFYFKSMKRLIILFVALFLNTASFAQLEVKEGSFKEVLGFVNINIEKMYDDNDKPYAVVKIKTENINDKERHQLLFEGDARTFFELDYKPGELWVYISYYATYLKISHPDFGSTEFWFPYDLEGKKGYEMTLVNKPSLNEDVINRLEALENTYKSIDKIDGGFGYLTIYTKPCNGSTVYIDDEEMKMKTPFVSDKISLGLHKIRVVTDMYMTYTEVVFIEENKNTTITIRLKKDSDARKSQSRHKGWFLSPEMNILGVSIHNSRGINTDPQFAFMPQLNVAYMFGHKFGIGVSIGLIYNNVGLLDAEGESASIPICGQISWYFSKMKTSPYINIKVGYLNGVYDKYKDYSDLFGICGSTSIGINIKHSKVGLSIMYCYYHGEKENTYFIGSSEHVIFGVSYGYIIPLSKH